MFKSYLFLPFLLLLICCTAQNVLGQLVVTPSSDDIALVKGLAGNGVIISNVVIDCPIKFPDKPSYGAFECPYCNLGIEKGILMTTGSITRAVGPNDQAGVGQDNQSEGDEDLDQIPGVSGTKDACSISFDIEAASDTISFRYVFGSDEYLEYIEDYNDVFAFYIEGPGVPLQNIALLPETNIAVSIDNVNDVVNNAFYVNNGTGNNSPQNEHEYYIQYDGFTKVLTAKAAIQACEKYRLKLVIADDRDHTLDSGVFLEAGSISTNEISLESSTDLKELGYEDFDFAVEGCVDGIINFRPNRILTESFEVFFEVLGTATAGADYEPLPSSIVLEPGTEQLSIPIKVFQDNITEGEETVIVRITDNGSCNKTFIDSTVLIIRENIEASAKVVVNGLLEDSIRTCSGAKVNLRGFGGLECTWKPTDFLEDPNDCNTACRPEQTMVYTLITKVGDCLDSATVKVIVDSDFEPTAETLVKLCKGQTGTLTASGGDFYVWEPADNLSCFNCPNPEFTGTESATYELIVYGNGGCSQERFTVEVEVTEGELGFEDESVFLCGAQTHTIDMRNVDSYVVTPETGIDCVDCEELVFAPTTSTVYEVTVVAGDCTQTFQVDIQVADVAIGAGEDVRACEAVNTMLGTPEITGFTYFWSPTTGLSDPNIAQPILSLDASTNNVTIAEVYTVTITSPDGSCDVVDEVLVGVDPMPQISLTAPSDTIEAGETVVLTVENYDGTGTYRWSGNNEPSTTNTLTVSPSLTTTYEVTLMTENGCEASASATVFVRAIPEVMAVTAFSPNEDQFNDVFRLTGIPQTNIQQLDIYNRWGNLVYSSSNDGSFAWDGTKDGIPQPVGVYFFIATYVDVENGEEVIIKGNISLVR